MTSSAIQQTVTGDHNIFTATGDINVTYNLPAPEAADHHNLTILLDRVEAFWIEGVLEQSLVGEITHALGKADAGEAVEHPWESVLEIPGERARTLARDKPIKPIYDQLGRSMLILGEPGSGKTITLLELARDLVHAARTDPSQPVPVVLNLSSWIGQPLERWLVEELKTKYFVAQRMARPLLEKNRLTLLLDGLDEVATHRQAECVDAINAYTESYGVPGFAACSRLAEYSALPVRLRLHGAIRLNALTPAQIDDYLCSLGEDSRGLRLALEQDEALASLARSPLMLSVMSIAYSGVHIDRPKPAGGPPIDARRAHVFESYIDRMFARKGKSIGGAQRSRDEGWLENLARCMRKHSQTVFTIEGMQPGWLPERRQRLLYTLQSRLIAGIILGVVEGFYLAGTGLMGNPRVEELMLGLALGIAFGLGAGAFDWLRMELGMRSATDVTRTSAPLIVSCLIVYFILFAAPFMALWGEDAPVRVAFGIVWAILFARRVRPHAAFSDIRAVEALVWSWRRAALGSTAGFGVGLVFSVGMFFAFKEALLSGDPRPWTYPIMMPFVYAVLGAVFGGIASASVESKTTPNQGMRLSRRNARFAGLLIGCTIAAMTPIYVLAPPIYFADPWPSWQDVVGLSLLTGIYFGVLAALWFGALDLIYQWTLRRRLAAAGVLPRRLEPFLDRMSRLALLRRVGGGYIFLHRLLLEHFADRGAAAATDRGDRVPAASLDSPASR